MNCTMRARKSPLAARHRARELVRPEPRHPCAGTTKPVIDSVIDSTSRRCRLVSPPPGATAAATPPAMIRASAASGGSLEDLGGGGEREPASRPASYSWTSSIRVPNAVFGCTNATVVPRLPGRGASSMTR